jgi:carbon-monoxide dehydrogenase medium subunit
VVARSRRGDRAIPAEEFFTGFLTTSLEADEVVTGIRIAGAREGWGWGFEEFSRRHGDFAVVGAAATVAADDRNRVADVRLVFSGVGATPVRAHDAEAVLRGQVAGSEAFREALAVAARSLEPPEDLHGSAAYRRQLAGVLGEQALTAAWERSRGGDL